MAMTQGSTLHVVAELANLAVVRHFVEEMAAGFGFGRRVIDDMLQAVDEAVANTVLHGYNGQPVPGPDRVITADAGRLGTPT